MAHIVEEVRARSKQGCTVEQHTLTSSTAQKIKRGLIQKAKIHKQYEKVRKRELGDRPAKDVTRTLQKAASNSPDVDVTPNEQEGNNIVDFEGEADDRSTTQDAKRAKEDYGPSSKDEEAASLDKSEAVDDTHMHPERKRMHRAKMKPFSKELKEAEKRRVDREAARKAREEALQERQRRLEERERWRKQMAKARQPGRNGQRKLGRESKVLLEKVQRLVGT